MFSIIYAIGNYVMSVTAIPGVTGDPPGGWGCILGLMLIALGTGGIKPCVNAFGADQLPKDDPKLMEVRIISSPFSPFSFFPFSPFIYRYRVSSLVI